MHIHLLAAMAIQHEVGKRNIQRYLQGDRYNCYFGEQKNGKEACIFQIPVCLHSGDFRQSICLSAFGSTILPMMEFISFNLSHQKLDA